MKNRICSFQKEEITASRAWTSRAFLGSTEWPAGFLLGRWPCGQANILSSGCLVLGHSAAMGMFPSFLHPVTESMTLVSLTICSDHSY